MDKNMVSKIWAGKFTANTHLFQFQLKLSCKHVDFECRYIRTHSEGAGDSLKFYTWAILPFSHQNTSIEFTILSTSECFGVYSMKPSDALQNERKI